MTYPSGFLFAITLYNRKTALDQLPAAEYLACVTPSEAANLTRFDGTRSGFYEVYFVEVQDPEHHSGLWVRYTLCSPTSGVENAVAELWGMYFDRRDPSKNMAIKETIPLSTATIGRDRFSFQLGDNGEINKDGCRGKLEDGDKVLEWDLSWGDDHILHHLPYEAMYTAPVPKSKVNSPHYDLCAKGHYTACGDRWELDDVPGQQSHIWGTEHARKWIWSHCNTFDEDPTAIFEGLSAHIKLGPLPFPPLTFYSLRYKGRDYIFNSPKQLLRENESRTDAKDNARDWFPVARWIVGGGDEQLRFRGELWADMPAYVGVSYKDPNGSPLVCNHSKVAHAKIEVMQPDGSGGWRVVDVLNSSGAALEFVGRQGDPRVPVLI